MEQTKRTRRIWRAGVVTVVLALAVVAIWKVWPRERLLTEVARPVVKVDVEKEQMCWKSDTQLLLLTTTGGRFPATQWKGFVDLISSNTGVRTRLSGLTTLLNRIGDDPSIGSDGFTSPDGTWFLWRSGVETYSPSLAHLDGTHYHQWKHTSAYSEEFYLDARHFVQTAEFGPVLIIRDLQNSARDRVYSKPDQAKAALALYATRHPVSTSVTSVGSPTERRIVITTDRTKDLIPLHLYLGNHSLRKPPYHLQGTLKLPGSTTLLEAQVSRQQQSVFYRMQVVRVLPLIAWLHRLLPKVDQQPVVTEELWVSHADGSGMHPVGSVPISSEKYADQVAGAKYLVFNPSGPDDEIKNVQWLPDGKQISFVYKGTLYVVPAVPGKQPPIQDKP